MDKQELLSFGASEREVVTLAQGKEVFIRPLSVQEILDLDAKAKKHKKNPSTLYIIASVCDQEGNPQFTEEDYSDVLRMPLRTATKLSEAIKKINGLSAEDVEQASKN